MTETAAPRRKPGWVVYAAALTVFELIGEVRNVAANHGPDAVAVANWILSAALLVALWGYALQKPIGAAAYWRVVFWIVLGATAIMLVPVAAGTLETMLFTAALLALVVPAFVAAFRYGHRSPRLWDPTES
jgi:predicted membrane channel-forming protein YqfA (hemolysin III family)